MKHILGERTMITQFYMPVKLIIGPGSVGQLGQEAKAIGKKALIVTYPDVRRVGILDKIIEDLRKNGVETAIFEEVEPNPRSVTIDKGAAMARKEKVDMIIGLGGGSAMDSAKGIALASSSTEPIWDYVASQAKLKGQAPFLIQVPTLAGTGSELNHVAVISHWETHDKRVLVNQALWAKVAVVDPMLTLTVPKKLTASGGVDTFAHLVETYLLADDPQPMNDAIRESVMRIVVKFLPRVLARLDDVEARTQLSWASTIAMSQLAGLGGTGGGMTCHGIEHAVSGYYDIPHGAGLAALLPAWMADILPTRKVRLDSLGKNVFGKSDGIAGTEAWLEKVGMRVHLAEFGCEPKRAEEIAAIALRSPGMLKQHPRPLDVAAIAKIYRDSC
jgi:alcohol dehydrogenase YqhD (iron-dependent ADH family)